MTDERIERLREIASEAEFLVARIGELEWSDFDQLTRDWNGHVDPPLSRLTKLLDALSTFPTTPSEGDGAGEDGLHAETARMLAGFGRALAAKLRAAEVKYGHTDNWRTDDWEEKCRADLRRHVEKGDPLDVAAYAAFCWARGWTTLSPRPPVDEALVSVSKVECVPLCHPFPDEDGRTEADPFWRIEVDGYCADFEAEPAARNFAAAINRRISALCSTSPPVDVEGLVEKQDAWIKLLRRHAAKTPEGLRLDHDAILQLADILDALRQPALPEKGEGDGALLLNWYNAQAAVVWAAWCAADDSSDDFDPETCVSIPNDSFKDLSEALEALERLIPEDSPCTGTGALNDHVRAALSPKPEGMRKALESSHYIDDGARPDPGPHALADCPYNAADNCRHCGPGPAGRGA